MKDLIIFSGAPSSGKTTVGELLQEKLNAPLIDFGWLRQGHLNKEWTNQSPEEEQMAFENLVFVIRNYLKHGYKNIIVNDLQEEKVIALANVFKDVNFVIISLVVSNDEELRRRVRERNSGFKNADEASEWNREVKERGALSNEFKIDNAHNDPAKTAQEILDIVGMDPVSSTG